MTSISQEAVTFHQAVISKDKITVEMMIETPLPIIMYTFCNDLDKVTLQSQRYSDYGWVVDIIEQDGRYSISLNI